jgi:type I restriction enzyme R subunit
MKEAAARIKINKLLGSANFLDTYVNREVFDQPEEYYTLDKLRRAAAVDRRLTLREILESKKYTELYTTSAFTTADLKAVPPKYRTLIPDYVKDYVSLNQFVA